MQYAGFAYPVAQSEFPTTEEREAHGRASTVKNFSRGVSTFLSADQSIANNLLTEVAFDSPFGATEYAQGSRVVIPSGKGGLYMVTLTVAFAVNGTGERVAHLMVERADGTLEVVARSIDVPSAGNEARTYSNISLDLQPGDQVYVEAFQTSGAALSVRGGDQRWTLLTVASDQPFEF